MQTRFRIDPEFEEKIPKISEDEFKQLRENILTAGEVYEPLVVWDGVLVDGHNRWKVIQENPEIKWRTREMDFPDKWAAFEWMYKNQLGRRNLTPEQIAYMRGKAYEAGKKTVGSHKGNQYTKSEMEDNLPIPSHKEGYAGKLGSELGVSHDTIKKDAKFAKGVDALREVSPEAADKVLNGKTGATKTDVQELAKAEPEIVEAFAKAIEENKKPVRPKRPPKTEEEKRDLAEIEAIMRDMRDPTTTPEFTIDFLIEDIELNGQTYVELLANTIADRKNLATDENKPLIVAAINKVVDGILKVRDSI
jgi:hypothetical protein